MVSTRCLLACIGSIAFAVLALPSPSLSQPEDLHLSPEGVPCDGSNLFSDGDVLVVKWNDHREKSHPQWATWYPKMPLTINPAPKGFDEPPKHPKALRKGEKFDTMAEAVDIPGKSLFVLSYVRKDHYEHSNGTPGTIDVSYMEIQALTQGGWTRIYNVSEPGGVKELGDPRDCSGPKFRLQNARYNNTWGQNSIYLDIHGTQFCNPDEAADQNQQFIYSLSSAHLSTTSPFSTNSSARSTWPLPNQRGTLTLSYWANERQWRFETFTYSSYAPELMEAILLPAEDNPSSVYTIVDAASKSIIVLWGSASGIKATFLTDRLQLIAANVQISNTRDSASTPTAVYRNDTLFVVWEDYRNGGAPNIYGTAFLAPKASGVVDGVEEENAGQKMSTQYERGSETITLRFALPLPQETEIELFDLQGNRVDHLKATAGTEVARFGASGLRSGMYLVRARSGTESCCRGIIYLLH